MKVIICCEGFNDIGPLTSFVKRCVNLCEIDVKCETHKSIQRIKLYHKRKQGRAAMIYKLYILALLEDSNHIGYHQDTDDRDFSDVYTGIKHAFLTNVPSNVKYLSIVLQKTMESWLLSDKQAYPNFPKAPSLPSKPEEIWGSSRDPGGNHPKRYFKRVLSQFGIAPNRNTYAQIAENTDIEVLKRRCPKSFGQFYADMQAFIGEENTP